MWAAGRSPYIGRNHDTSRKAKVRFHDPFVARLRTDRGVYTRTRLTAKALAGADCVVIVTDHSEYDYAWIAEHARRILDTRNATKGVRRGAGRIVKL